MIISANPPTSRVEDISVFMRRAPALNRLTLAFVDEHPGLVPFNSVVELVSHSVTRLSLQFQTPQFAKRLMDIFVLPTLTDLSLTVTGRATSDHFSSCFTSGNFNVPRLRHLRILGFDEETYPTSGYPLLLFTSLRSLRLDSAALLSGFLERVCTRNTVPICPQLVDIYFDQEHAVTANFISMGNMSLVLRVHNGSRLQAHVTDRQSNIYNF